MAQHSLYDLIAEMDARPNEPIFMDSETLGFHGMPVLMQFAVGNGKIYLIEMWREVACETVDLMEKFANHEGGIVMFNAAFDWFHCCKWFTVISYWMKEYDREFEFPQDFINEIARSEEHGRFGQCLKPKKILDLMLVARKTEYQSLMERNPIRITRIPTQIAPSLVAHLNEKVPLKDVYFARYKDPSRRWQIMDIRNDLEEIIPEFKDLVLKFAPSSGLKALAQDALGYRDTVSFTEVEPPHNARPVESGWAPFCTAPLKHSGGTFIYPSEKNNWLDKWPAIGKIKIHIDHWAYNEAARDYALKDIVYTRGMYNYFGARRGNLGHEEARVYATTDDCHQDLYPYPMNDDDSVIACTVAAVRWAGFEIDVKGIGRERDISLAKQKSAKHNYNSPMICRNYLTECMTETEMLAMKKNGKLSTGGVILESVAKWKEAEVCDDCYGEGCEKCEEGFVPTDLMHEAAKRAAEILEFRHAGKRADMLAKLLMAGRFHASFKVIGALSGRMAGGDGLNAQGIESTKAIRKLFNLAGEGEALSIGDYTAFEVMIMNAVYKDPQLIEDSTSTRACSYCGGKGCDECDDTGIMATKLYGIGGALFFDKTYDEVMLTKGLRGEKDLYKRSKSGVLALFFQGEAYTLATRIGVQEKQGEEGYNKWQKRYHHMYHQIALTNASFRAIEQEGGLGSCITWEDPQDNVETLFGFKRWFTLEIQIMKALFELGEKPPQEWRNVKAKVTRRDREQTASGAARSAVFGGAFKIQGSIQRAAGNHRIQGTGAAITKGLQVAIWELQPAGVADWHVKPMNIHDEVPCVHKPELREAVADIVTEYNEKLKKIIPLLDMEWDSNAVSWADK